MVILFREKVSFLQVYYVAFKKIVHGFISFWSILGGIQDTQFNEIYFSQGSKIQIF